MKQKLGTTSCLCENDRESFVLLPVSAKAAQVKRKD